MNWQSLLKYALEEESLSVTGRQKLSVYCKMLTAHMARKDYFRAGLVADQIEACFHFDHAEQPDYYFVNKLFPEDQIALIRVLMGLLFILTDRRESAFIDNLFKAGSDFCRVMNYQDHRLYECLFAAWQEHLSFDKPLDLISDDHTWFITNDPWLSDKPSVHDRWIQTEKSLIRSFLKNIEDCPDESIKELLIT